jgi:hypothetical protein
MNKRDGADATTASLLSSGGQHPIDGLDEIVKDSPTLLQRLAVGR